MSTPLETWQEKLEGHFQALASKREGSGFPLFAIEHDLDDQQLGEISTLLCSRVNAGLCLSPYWLVGAVYVTEHGYSYNGDEYWQSFGEHTPNWESSDRYKIVPWFKKFQRTYNGVVPSGPWAEQFRIIAWPITHAILPRYLQSQFAEALYDLRFRLAGIECLEPSAIGRLLAANAYRASTRFEKFLQQEELTGRIVLAFLHEDLADGQEPISPLTLKRLAADLYKVRNAREWLRETQHLVTDRFKGIGRGTAPLKDSHNPATADTTAKRTAHPEIRPGLILRYAGSFNWSVLLEVPSFQNIAALNADIRTFLKRTRCRLNGADDLKPAGWILSGKRRGVLNSWPDPDKPLIAFDQLHSTVDHLLATECRMSAGPVWLFRIGRDGTAREIAGRIVRPGQEYIVITTGGLPEPLAGMTSCGLACSGVRSFRIAVPGDVSAEYIRWLHDYGLQLARTICVWPAGLPGRGWNGEGSSEWLTTEAPCFGIVHDHPVDAYVLQLNNGAGTLIQAGKVGYPVFARLPPLPAGTHFLTVKAQRSASLAPVVQSPEAEGFVELKVREPEPWTPGTASHAGLIVSTDPYEISLDTFWENDFKLSVIGPESHNVTCKVSLESGQGEEIFSEQVDGPMDLPIAHEMWGKRFGQFVRREDCAWRHLEASAGTLTIKGDELGEYTIRFERELVPIRWVRRHDHGGIMLRLIDDTGQEDSEPKCFFFEMERPASAQPLAIEEARRGISVNPPGGLFVAQHGDFQDLIVVSVGVTAKGLKGLNISPEFSEFQNSSVSMPKYFCILRRWRRARLAGFLPDIRRQTVAEGFASAIYERLCGANWARAEAAFLAGPHARRAIDNLQRAVGGHGGFSAVLHRDYAIMKNNAADGSQWFADLASRYRVCQDDKLCDFALRLASQPHRLPKAFQSQLDHLLDQIGGNPALLRGARLLALLCANEDREQQPARTPEWQW